MVYKVETRYEDFVFEDGDTAIRVAEILVKNSVHDITVKITVQKEADE